MIVLEENQKAHLCSHLVDSFVSISFREPLSILQRPLQSRIDQQISRYQETPGIDSTGSGGRLDLVQGVQVCHEV